MRDAQKSYVITYRLMLATIIAGAMIGGCAPTHFGGRSVEVTLKSPEPGVAYILPKRRLDDDPSVASSRQSLDDIARSYNKGSIGPGNDIELHLYSQQWVFIVARTRDGKLSHPVIFDPVELHDQGVRADFKDGNP